MKPYQANLINAAVLIVLGLWGYFSSESPSPTALIPVAFGAIFAIATPPFKKDNKIVAHIIVLLTFLLILALFMPLRGALERGDTSAALRVGLMVISSLAALVVYIMSFVKVRRERNNV